MDGVVKADRTLIELNLLLLLFVALVPWPTGLLADYLLHGSQGNAAAVTYGLVMMLMAASFTAIWLWLAREEDLTHPSLRPRIRLAVRRSSVGPGIYLAGTLTALVSAPVSFAMYAGAAAFFAPSGRGRPPATSGAET